MNTPFYSHDDSNFDTTISTSTLKTEIMSFIHKDCIASNSTDRASNISPRNGLHKIVDALEMTQQLTKSNITTTSSDHSSTHTVTKPLTNVSMTNNTKQHCAHDNNHSYNKFHSSVDTSNVLAQNSPKAFSNITEPLQMSQLSSSIETPPATLSQGLTQDLSLSQMSQELSLDLHQDMSLG